jgi:transposase
MNPAPSSTCAAFVGIDWADNHHDYCLFDPAAGERQHGRFDQTPEALGAWIQHVRERFGGQPVVVCLEQSRGPLIYALMEHAFFVLYPINPKTLAKYREAFTPSGAKDDPTDAALLCELVVQHRDRLTPWQADDAQTRQLAALCEQRRHVVDVRTQLIQQTTAALKSYFPQALAWSGRDLHTPMAADFLLKWPTLETIQRAKPAALRAFYYGHNCRSETLIQQRLEEIRAAQPLTSDPAIVQPLALTVQTLARLLRDLAVAVAEYDRQIRALFRQHPDAFLFDNLPGAGAQLGPRLLTAFGTDRHRYPQAAQLQTFSGIAPVLERSGQQTWVHWRWHRPIFLCQTFYEFAQKSTEFSTWAHAYYQLQQARGKSAHASIRALAFKWIRVLFRCWQQREPYDEARYLAALRKHASPLLAYIPQTVLETL